MIEVLVYSFLTELMVTVFILPVMWHLLVTVTIQLPHPPSLQVVFVPLSWALSRMKSDSLVLGSQLAREIE